MAKPRRIWARDRTSRSPAGQCTTPPARRARTASISRSRWARPTSRRPRRSSRTRVTVGAGRSSGAAVTVLAAVLAAAGIAQAWDLARRSAGSDFYQFWMVSGVIGRADVPSIYDEEAHARLGAEFIRRSFTDDDSERRRRAAREWQVLQPTATPLLYAAFRPLTGLRYEHAHLLFRTVSLAAAAAALVAIALLVGLSPAAALLAVAFVALAFHPLKASIQVGNVS